MSRSENIAVLNRNITVEGCTFTETGLVFARADADTLARASACLQKMDACGDWWWGDYLVAYAQLRLEADNDAQDLAAMDEATQEQHRRHYVRNHASVVDGRQKADTQIVRYRVAAFYNRLSRLNELSNEHHREAMDQSDGDSAKAQEWLAKAVENGWSSNALRTEMRAAKRAGISDPPTRVRVTQHELFAFERWTRVQLQRTDQMEIDEVDAMIADATKAATNLTALITALAAQRHALAANSVPANSSANLLATRSLPLGSSLAA